MVLATSAGLPPELWDLVLCEVWATEPMCALRLRNVCRCWRALVETAVVRCPRASIAHSRMLCAVAWQLDRTELCQRMLRAAGDRRERAAYLRAALVLAVVTGRMDGLAALATSGGRTRARQQLLCDAVTSNRLDIVQRLMGVPVWPPASLPVAGAPVTLPAPVPADGARVRPWLTGPVEYLGRRARAHLTTVLLTRAVSRDAAQCLWFLLGSADMVARVGAVNALMCCTAPRCAAVLFSGAHADASFETASRRAAGRWEASLRLSWYPVPRGAPIGTQLRLHVGWQRLLGPGGLPADHPARGQILLDTVSWVGRLPVSSVCHLDTVIWLLRLPVVPRTSPAHRAALAAAQASGCAELRQVLSSPRCLSEAACITIRDRLQDRVIRARLRRSWKARRDAG